MPYVDAGYWVTGYTEGDADLYLECGYTENGYLEGDEVCVIAPVLDEGGPGRTRRKMQEDDERAIMLCMQRFMELVNG